MQIKNNNYNQSPNFTSIRVVDANINQFIKFSHEYSDFFKKNTVFKAESPYHTNFYKSFIKVAKNENCSVEWALLNAERHGLIDRSKFDNLPMFVITGTEQFKLFIKLLKNNLKLLLSGGNYKAPDRYIPEHLIESYHLKSAADEELPSFNKFLKKNNAKYVTYDEFVKEVKAGTL